jgi:hypothetical protein
MTREQIIRIAREAGFNWAWISEGQPRLERFYRAAYAAGAAAEREKVAAWMIRNNYATGHGDTTEDLLSELEWQVRESERKAILKKADSLGWVSVDHIRARGET